MKRSFPKLVILIFAVCSAASSLLAQSEAERLNAKLAELYRRGDLDAAVQVAEEIVTTERRNSPVSSTNLVSSLENLAQVKLDRVKRSMSDLRAPELKPEKASAILKVLRQDAAEAEGHFHEAIQLLPSSLKNPQQAISLRTNLAWLLYNHIPIEPNPSLGFGKDDRDKLEMRYSSLYFRRFNEARTLYTEAVKVAADHDVGGIMAVKFSLAEFESAMGNFEAAVPLYADVVAAAEKVLGRTNPELIPPYESFLKVLVAAGQSDQAFEVLSKIVTISGKSAQYPKTLLNLTYRADKPFVPVNSKRIEDDSRAMKEQAELAGRGTVARTAAAGGDIVGTSLAVSTHGRDYYETSGSKGVKMRRIPVRIEVDERGKVTAVEGLTSDRDFKRSAEAAVREWKFRPLFIGGKPSKLKGYAEVTILSN